MTGFIALRERLRLSLWFIPALFAVGAALLATALLAVDQATAADDAGFFRFGGTAEGARSVLSTIAQSMLTFTGLVFSITMLVLQLASSQLSPRVMRTFLRDRKNQVVLGLFVATFVFTLLVLRDVRTPVDGESGFVPGVSIWVAFILLLASVAAFIYYIDHMAHAIRASTVIQAIAGETRASLERLFPERVGGAHPGPADQVHELGPPSLVLKAERQGVLVSVDEQALLERTSDGARRAELVPSVGDFLPLGGPLFRLWGDWQADAASGLRDAVELGPERTLEQDAAFGFRQLVDVAVRALSPGTNDPTTAVQSLDQLHDLLRGLAGRHIPAAVRCDDAGRVRLVVHRPGWDEYVRLAIDEIRIAGSNQVQVVARLLAMLDDLLDAAPGDRQAVLRVERERVEAGARAALAGADVELVRDAVAARRPPADGRTRPAPSPALGPRR